MRDELEPNAEERRRLAAAAIDFAEEYLEARATEPASWPPPSLELIEELAAPPAEEGTDLDALLATFTRALPHGLDTSSGKFLSYIPGGGLYTAAVARLLGAVTNRYTGGSHGAPGLIALEHGVIRWLCGVFGLPETATGVLLSGGSTANLTATVAARSRLGDEFGGGVVYMSERAHHSVAKAARIAGIHPDRVRDVRVDGDLRLDIAALRAAVATDLAAGLTPMMIAVSAGTTDTGTVDPLPQAAAVAADTGAWFHVDAAYGGFFVLTDRGRSALAGIELADSITLDAHKGLFLPFGVGGLLVRDEAELMSSLDGRGSYMQDVPAHGKLVPNYFALSPELTRPARGLEVWLALHLHGIAAFRHTLDRMLDLARETARDLAAIPGIELVTVPDLSIVAVRAADGDATTGRIKDHLIDSGDVHVSTTTVDGRLVVRLAFLSHRTTAAIAARAVELVGEVMAAG